VGGAIWLMRQAGSEGDPSLREQNDSVQDDSDRL